MSFILVEANGTRSHLDLSNSHFALWNLDGLHEKNPTLSRIKISFNSCVLSVHQAFCESLYLYNTGSLERFETNSVLKRTDECLNYHFARYSKPDTKTCSQNRWCKTVSRRHSGRLTSSMIINSIGPRQAKNCLRTCAKCADLNHLVYTQISSGPLPFLIIDFVISNIYIRSAFTGEQI